MSKYETSGLQEMAQFHAFRVLDKLSLPTQQLITLITGNDAYDVFNSASTTNRQILYLQLYMILHYMKSSPPPPPHTAPGYNMTLTSFGPS